MKTISIDTTALANEAAGFFNELIKRRLSERTAVRFTTENCAVAELTIELRVDQNMKEEAFRITHGSRERVTIEGSGKPGLLYGVGKFLRTAEWEQAGGQGFGLGNWQGESIPAKEVRGIYFATHFRNFYHRAPVGEIEQYLEDLALWGFNALTVWFDMHHFKSISDPEAQAMIARLQAILSAAHRIGLKIGLLVLGNEAYADSPVDLRGSWQGGQNGYFSNLPMYRVELCPSNPAGFDLLLRWRKEVFQAFADLPLSFVWVWPYDQGGCGCAECAPWGGNGFLKIARPVAEMAREFFPSAKVIVSTWYFDCYTEGEFEAFHRRLENDHDWFDYVMAEHPGKYPAYILEHGTPGRLPLLGFPEISMFESQPWGGFGANPLPGYLSQMWAEIGDRQAGGFPYSEGIFEDMNKAMMSWFYWTGSIETDDALREYANFYFSTDSAGQVAEAAHLLESANCRERLRDGKPEWMPETPDSAGDEQFVIAHPQGAQQSLRILAVVDAALAPRQKTSWRWRILYLRAQIDSALAQNDFRIDDHAEAGFDELINIYHAEDAVWAVRPPSRCGRVTSWG